MSVKSASILQHKKALLSAMEKTLCNVTAACKKADTSRDTFYRYYREDEAFKKAIDDLQDVTFDFVEGKLLKQINDENTAATIFYAKTKMKHRGYVERTEITGAGGDGLKVTWEIPTNNETDGAN